MGRTNHHAGLHMIYFNRYGQYDDLAYYDKLVEENEAKKRKILAEKQDAIDRAKKAATKELNGEREVSVKTKNNLDDKEERKDDSNLIGDVYFRRCADIYANIFLLAFERKIDVANMIKECEYIMANDKTIERRAVYGITPIESSYIFLQLLADKMGCDVVEFLSTSKEVRKEKINAILDVLMKECQSSRYIQGLISFGQEFGEDEYGVSNYDGIHKKVKITRLNINPYAYLDLNTRDVNNLPNCNMYYYIDKVVDEIKKYTRYYLVVGTRSFSYEQPFEYMYGGSVVYSEKTGKMKNFFETLLVMYENQGGIINDFII